MYIKKVEIKNLWGNDYMWKLHDDVNVLIGHNGFGKSTMLQMIHEAILPPREKPLNYRLFDPIDKIIIELDNDVVVCVSSEERTITGNKKIEDYSIKTTLIDTFDVLEKSLNPNATLLDYQLDKLRQKFVVYQRDLSNQVEEALISRDSNSRSTELERIAKIYDTKNIFLEILNGLFRETGKKFNEKEFYFEKLENTKHPIIPSKLSSGEKQILIILLTVLLQDKSKFLLIMDEPEISLHIDWQRKLITNIRQVNPNVQIILATHSPTVYYQGWTEKVTRIEDIRTPINPESTIITEKAAQNNQQIERIFESFQGLTGGKPSKLYQFNKNIASYTSFTKQESIELLNYIKQKEIYPDVVTFTTLISKVNNFDDAKFLFDLIETEKYTQLTFVQPNDITLNTLIKKVNTVEQGIRLIQSVSTNEKLQLHPDIITFSTLLGKAKTIEEVNLIEEARNYFSVKVNDIYSNKLKFKQ